ncbi:MAG TPA: tetratricopeptide repeat protein [Verrucomicrobiae bacterium]|nr:tetratricopeptide repeat protein [Verrucomicrobiae bacterium]
MSERSQRARNLVICLCLASVTAVVYWPVRHFDFITYDDPQYIAQNRHVQEGLTLRGLAWAFTTSLDQWMPVTWLTRILEHQFFGLNAGAQHLVNLLFHILNALLLFSVLRRMTAAPWRSAVVAALFALHPLHVEPVAWVTGLKDLLSTFFGLLTIAAYTRYVEVLKLRGSRGPLHGSQLGSEDPWPNAHRSPPSPCRFSSSGFYVLALALFALALMAKPMMVTLPFVLVLLDYWPLGRTPWAKSAATPVSEPATGNDVAVAPSQLLKEKLPFFLLAAAAAAATYWAQRGLGAVVTLAGLPLRVRIANALLSYVGYLGKAIWPSRLAFFYPLNTSLSLAAVTGAGAGLAGLTAAVIWMSRRAPWLVTGWFWYLGTLVPVIGLVQVGYEQAMADRYTYIPLIGLFMMLCWSVPRRVRERRMLDGITCVATAAMLAACAVLSRIQAGYWRNSESLYRHALNVTPNNWLAHGSLGTVLLGTGRASEAIQQYEEALRLEPAEAQAQNNLGLALWQSGRVPEAIQHYQQALQMNPHYAEAHHNLGLALLQMGRLQEAIEQFGQVVQIKPRSAEAHRRLGLALRQAGKSQEAAAQFNLAVRLPPDSAETYNDLGNDSLRAGKIEEAIDQYEQALRLEPDFADALNNLAWLLATLGRAEGGDPVRAVALARRACALTGNRVSAYLDTLAAAYAGAGRFDNAVTAAQQALALARSAGQQELAGGIEERLQLYRSGRPYSPPRIPAATPHNP